MAVPTIIVDGKNSEGKRLSVSIDMALWSLYVASRGHDLKLAKTQLRQRMSLGKIVNTYDAKCWIYTEIAKPTLLIEPIEGLEPA